MALLQPGGSARAVRWRSDRRAPRLRSSLVLAGAALIAANAALWGFAACKAQGPESRFAEVRRVIVDDELFVHLNEYQDAADVLKNVGAAVQILADLHTALSLAAALPYGKDLVKELGMMVVLEQVTGAIAELDVVQTVRRTVTGLASYEPELRQAYDRAGEAPGPDTFLALADVADRGVRLLEPVQTAMRLLHRGTEATAQALEGARRWTGRCARGDGVSSFACDLAEPAVTKLHNLVDEELLAWVAREKGQIEGDVGALAQVAALCRQ